METPKNLFPHKHFVSAELRKKLINQKPILIWLSGISGSGKSTNANELEKNAAHSIGPDASPTPVSVPPVPSPTANSHTSESGNMHVCQLELELGPVIPYSA